MRCERRSGSSAGPCLATRSAATSPSNTRSATRTACRASSSSTPAATAAGRRRTRRGSSPERGFSPRTVGLASRFLNGRIRPREFLPALIRLGGAYNPHTSLLAAAREAIAERRCEDAARGADLRGPATAQGLDGHGPAGRDPGADARDGGTGRLPVSARAPGAARGRDPQRAACGSSSAPATTHTRSGRPRSSRPSGTSCPRRRSPASRRGHGCARRWA